MQNVNRKKGISLIEVLIVLVVVTIGILSVIRLFPPGFLINQQTEALSRASSLARLEANRWQLLTANLPDAIVPVVYDGTSFVVDDNTSPDDMVRVPREPAGQFPWSYYFSDVNRTRRVLGETVRIPIPSPTVAGKGSIYVLMNGPFMDVTWPGQTDSIFVQGAPLIRRTDVQGGSGTLPGDYGIGNSSYLIDYTNQVIGFSVANFDRTFLVTASYVDNTGKAVTIVDQAISVPANFNTWIPIDQGSSRNLIPYSDVVGRKFVNMHGAPWTTDPYQFTVASPTIAGLGNVGVILFNPAGRDYTENTVNGNQPLTARIDYDVADWRIIKEDRQMPASSPYNVALTLKDLKKFGDFNDDQSAYNGIYYGVTAANNVGDLMVYDLTAGTLVPPVDPVTGSQNYSINYKDGIVTFSDTFGSANAAASYRFFYKSNGDWALLTQKAVSSYSLSSVLPLAYNQAYQDPLGTLLYFPLSEAGKSFIVRDLYYKDGNNNTQHVSNETFRINDSPSQYVNFTVNGASVPYTFIDLKTNHPDAVSWDATATGNAISGIQGISIRTRVVWSNGSTINQDSTGTSIPRTRYRKVDLNTILTRTTGK